MKSWTIAYQYNTLTFVMAVSSKKTQMPVLTTEQQNNGILDDEDLALCFQKLIETSDSPGRHLRVLCRRGMRRVVNYCMEHYIYIRAAGGVVSEPAGNELLIYRNNRWDLPKGGVEADETLKQTAIREVMEETAMHDLACGELITKTYHIYNLYGGWHLKQTSWFRMTVPAPYSITTQQEEGITTGAWVSQTELRKRLCKSYATLRAVAIAIQDYPPPITY